MNSKKLTPDQVRQTEAVVGRVPGVASCRIRTDATGEIREVHVAATPGRSPAAVAHDVEACLKTDLNLEVNPAMITVSVAEAAVPSADPDLEEFPILEHSSRFAFMSVNVVSSRDGVRAEVELARDLSATFGASTSPNTSAAPWPVIADATLRAISEFLDDTTRLCLSGVVKVPMGDDQAVVVRVDVVFPRCTKSLAGCALVDGNENQSVVFATLDAVNRVIGKLNFRTSVEYKIQ